MIRGLYGAEERRSLLKGDSVLDGVFDYLRRIWSQPAAIYDRQLGGSEYETRSLEQLAHLASELYTELHDRMGDHPLPDIDHGCGILIDVLSIREGCRLARDLPRAHDWEVDFDWAAVKRLPTKTRFICEAWFDSYTPSAVDRPNFRDLVDMEVPPPPNPDPEFVWTRIPDKRVKGAVQGNYSVESLTDIYEDTRELLVGINGESAHDGFFVTSDHGNVNHLGSNLYALGDDLGDILAAEFDGRHREVTNSYACRQLDDTRVIVCGGGHYVIKGH